MSARPRIAYLTPNAIFPFNRGGRIRAYHLWRALSAFGDVWPMIIGDAPSPQHRSMFRPAEARFYPRRKYPAGDINKALARSVPGLWEVTAVTDLPPSLHADLEAPDSLVRHFLNPRRIERLLEALRKIRPSLIYLCDTTLGVLAPHVRSLDVPIVVGPHNLDSALYASMAATAPTDHVRQWNELAAKAFDAAERQFAPYVDQLWVCSREDVERFSKNLVSPDKIKFVPNAFDIGPPTPLPEESRDLVFVGQANYYPNEDAIKRLLTISRKLDDKNVAHRIRVVGRTRDQLRQLAATAPSVEIVGEVESVLPYIDSAFIAPIALTLGGGTRLKILEALSRARLVLSTPIGIEGIEAENGVSAIIEPDLALFPERIEEMFRDRKKAQRIALAGWELVREKYSHEALLDHVGTALCDLGLNRNGPSAKSLARNVGTRIVSENATYNPATRLLSWMIQVRLAAGFEDVGAEFVADSGETPANAFVRVRPRRPGLFLLDATAVLPADIAPNEMRIRLRAWGREVFLIPPAADLKFEAAGLMTLEASRDKIEVSGWCASGQATIGPNAHDETKLCEGVSVSAGLSIVEASFNHISEKIEIEDHSGVGQIFTDLARWLGPHSPTSARLRSLKDKHKGETAWLIGNGPSVRIEDLDRLEGRLTFCFNRFHLANTTTRLRASYTLSGDKQMIEDFGQSIVDESGGTVFLAHDRAPDLVGDYIWLRQASVFPPLFSRDPSFVVSPGGSTPFVAMQVAYYMGVRKFYIYGADFSFRFDTGQAGGDPFRSVKGEGNHFIANYRSGKPWCPPSLRDISAAFLTARLLMETEGGFVHNVTRGGALEIFERCDFDRALEANASEAS